MSKCIFCKIAKHEIQKEFIYEDKDIMVFPDINPAKEIHILLVPKKHLVDFMELKDKKLMVIIFSKFQEIVKDQGLEDKGFKLFLNGGGAQIIDHLHIHLTGPWKRDERWQM
jgi:histidine triad (HIT) family protein